MRWLCDAACDGYDYGEGRDEGDGGTESVVHVRMMLAVRVHVGVTARAMTR
jgi:hypothetical protein